MASPDITAIAGYAGKYQKQLFSTLINSLDVAKDVTVYPDVKNKLHLTKLKIKKGARPFTSAFTGTNNNLQEFTGRVIEAHLGKIEDLLDPVKYRQTWLSEVMKAGVNVSGAAPDIPFAGYIWEQYMKGLASEINDDTAYLGVHNAAGTTAPDITNGFGTLLAAEITAGNVVPVTTGAITSANAYAQFTMMWRSLPVVYRKAGAAIYASYNSIDALYDDFENKVSKYTEADQATGKVYLAKTDRKCELIPATWMNESSRLIATPRENMIMSTDQLSDMNKINTKPELWTLEVGIAFACGFQFRDLEALRCNDVA